MKSFIFYQGPSQLDGAPIVGIAVLKSENGKTGNMVQTYILRADMHPLEALASGADASICGTCIHRPRRERRRDKRGRFTVGYSIIRTCYVDVAKSVSSVYRAFMNGSYDVLEPVDGAARLAGRMVRLGAYGPPMSPDRPTVVSDPPARQPILGQTCADATRPSQFLPSPSSTP